MLDVFSTLPFVQMALYIIFASCLVWTYENYDGFRQGPKWFITASLVVAIIGALGGIALIYINTGVLWWQPLAMAVIAGVIGSILSQIPYSGVVAGVLTWILLIYQLFVNPAYLHF